MDILEAIKNRHSVRNYLNKEIEEQKVEILTKEIDTCNREQALDIQLITKDTDVFKGLLAHYGGFRNVSNYIALIGPDDASLDERAGYYGEYIVLLAQQLGLNTCWVAATYKKNKCKIHVKDHHRLVCVIALGYGETQGVEHKSKTIEEVSCLDEHSPIWFRNGVEAALLAPTAMNKQNFFITLANGEEPHFEMKNSKYSKVDLGIIKYHFQVGSTFEKQDS